MNFVVDIDNTLLLYPDGDNYNDAVPNIDEIKILNSLYVKGHIIIIHTGRNWDKYEFTKKQLKDFGIKYHELVMGKPQGIYIDTDSYQSLREYL